LAPFDGIYSPLLVATLQQQQRHRCLSECMRTITGLDLFIQTHNTLTAMANLNSDGHLLGNPRNFIYSIDIGVGLWLTADG
jgi:hypothetical protein